MKFSIILNSRLRPQLLEKLIKSIITNTSDISQIEMLISCDTDDVSSRYLATKYEDWPFIKFEFIVRERNLHKRLNHLARMSKGKYIFVLNDDCELVTPDWDQISWKALEIFDDNIVYGRTHDNSCDKGGDKEYASFPIISKRAVDILGFFMHEYFVGLGGDVGIYRVYKGINRIVDVPIDIDHKLHTTVEHVMSPDIVAQEMRQNTYQNPIEPFSFDVRPDIEKFILFVSKESI